MFKNGDRVELIDVKDLGKNGWAVGSKATVTKNEGGLTYIEGDDGKKTGLFPYRLAYINPPVITYEPEAFGYEFKVEHIATAQHGDTLAKLEDTLNDYDQTGWEIMNVSTAQQGYNGYVIIARKAKDV